MTKLYSLATIRKKVREYGKKINAPKNLLSVRSTTDGFGTPHIEIDKNGYNYVIWERGREHERKTTKDFHRLIYWIFKDIVFKIASDYELDHRNPNEDFRRLLFSKILELFEILDKQWFIWEKEDIESILKENPYEP
jgi:hypothetical protein